MLVSLKFFTAEDVLELQAHGGPVVLQLVRLLLARCLEAGAPTSTTRSIACARRSLA